MSEHDPAPRPRRNPTIRQSVIGGGIVVVVGLLLAAGAVYISARTGGDLTEHVGSRRSGVPAWFAISVITFLSLVVTVFGVLMTALGIRAARSGDSPTS
ncbi:hypothetical protein [Agromyces atrinae]|uniref:Cell division septal protein FtsQ n=1 Tax=Agromyces atrinae TaxID=592376 RepID=A0A4V1R2F3_9MICO|nr:hypothetical protein [Agromyces atrinae]NYD67210.1 cell division septal protein FtsQ [Agromyces atrinae]RXZ86956.1 hypothetical protein ESP50_07795 [Agromyces atrinae]